MKNLRESSRLILEQCRIRGARQPEIHRFQIYDAQERSNRDGTGRVQLKLRLNDGRTMLAHLNCGARDIDYVVTAFFKCIGLISVDQFWELVGTQGLAKIRTNDQGYLTIAKWLPRREETRL
jgi:hypothetical protein